MTRHLTRSIRIALGVLVLVCLSLLPSRVGASTGPPFAWGTWGDGSQLSPKVLSPASLGAPPGTLVQIATTNENTYALTSSGVYSVGFATHGGLGDGDSSTALVTTWQQVAIPSGVTIASLVNPSPDDTGEAIDSNGNVWVWGFNGSYQGCLNKTNRYLPVESPNLSNVSLAAGAGQHSIYVSNGRLVACGKDAAGELGNGAMTTSNSAVPASVSGLPPVGVVSLGAAWESSQALLADGTLWDWGYGAYGQLGNGSTSNSSLPVQVPIGEPVTAASQGGCSAANGQSLALGQSGTLYEWGFDATATPTAVSGLPSVGTFFSGGDAFYVVDSSGNLWTWGTNAHGELGDGTTHARTVPEDVLAGITTVSATSFNVAAA